MWLVGTCTTLNVALLVLKASTGARNDAIGVRPFERIGLIGVLE